MIRAMIIGSLPPPIGGVTIHIDRFFNLFKDKTKFELSVLDIKKKTLFLKNSQIKSFFGILLYFLKTKIVHIHISNDTVKLFFALLSKLMLKKVIYTHHNSLVKNRFVFKMMYKICDRVILVNEKEISKDLIIKNKTEVIPAFLPPYQFEDLPHSLESEIKEFDNIISTNCYLYNLINGKHVYGFDLIVEAFYNLSKNKKINNTLLILVDPSNTTGEFVDSLVKNKDFGTNKLLHITQNLDFVSLVKKSNITIRATRTDGDSLSIRESLYFNIPIIASDVTIRPAETIVFKSDDSVDLENKILNILENREDFEYEHINYGQKILDLYSEVLK
jgi:glycosyltransferase involved in cell wall biosynthesis